MGSTPKQWGSKIIAAFIILLVAAILSQVVGARFFSQKATLHLGEGTFTATIADTNDARMKGLSGTLHLPADQAMVLAHDENGFHSIWMKDMHYAIDVVWLNESKQVVDYVINVPADSYPRVFSPKQPVRYVVELKSGTVKAKDIRVGQQAIFSGTSKEL